MKLIIIILDGFRKLVSVDKTSLCYMKSSGEDLHFMHPKFVRGYSDLMLEIKRQTNPTKKLTAAVPKQQAIELIPQDENDDSMTTIPHRDLVSMMSELSLLRQKTDDLECIVDSLNRSHDMLWQEMRILRETNAKQSDCFDKLIQFLISVMPANKRLARRQRPFVESDNNLIVASRHGCDILSCIQQELHESVDISKQSVFEENDTKNENDNEYQLTLNDQNWTNQLSMVQQQNILPNNQQLLPISTTRVFQAPKVEIVSCRPSTSYGNSTNKNLNHGVNPDVIRNTERYDHIYHPISPLMPDESLLEELDNDNLLQNPMEFFDGTDDGNNDFNWDNLMELSPEQHHEQ